MFEEGGKRPGEEGFYRSETDEQGRVIKRFIKGKLRNQWQHFDDESGLKSHETCFDENGNVSCEIDHYSIADGIRDVLVYPNLGQAREERVITRIGNIEKIVKTTTDPQGKITHDSEIYDHSQEEEGVKGEAKRIYSGQAGEDYSLRVQGADLHELEDEERTAERRERQNWLGRKIRIEGEERERKKRNQIQPELPEREDLDTPSINGVN